MTHIVGIVEGPYDHVDRFMKFWDGKMYCNGKARVRPRVILPVNFGINKCGRDEFLKDLRCYSGVGGSNISDGSITKNKFFSLAKILSKIFPKMKPIIEEFKFIERSNMRKEEDLKGNACLATFYPVGEIEDRILDGREIV